jgi:hypothetical protein
VRELDVDFKPTTLTLEGGARVDVDGADAAEATLVEIFARRGA